MTESLRLLVAEDDPAIQKLLSHVLNRAGHTVTIASDGQEALDLLETEQYDAILLDLMMPRVSGADVLAYLGENQPDTLAHVIVVSAYTRMAETLIPQACKIVTKPFDIGHLLETVRSCVSAN